MSFVFDKDTAVTKCGENEWKADLQNYTIAPKTQNGLFLNQYIIE
jgi:hypothetical protein